MTAEQRRRAIHWRNHGKTPAFIAERLGRTADEVVEFLSANKRGSKNPNKTERICLGPCRKPFMSDGDHNRMCDRCRAASRDVPPMMIEAGNGCRVAGAGRRG